MVWRAAVSVNPPFKQVEFDAVGRQDSAMAGIHCVNKNKANSVAAGAYELSECVTV
jgi:hypothetical protein